MKYGIIKYERGISPNCLSGNMQSINIGDYIQLNITKLIYDKMNIENEYIVSIEYKDLFSWDGETLIVPLNLILINPYYGEKDLVFSKNIIPVFLGIHLWNDELSKNEQSFFSKFQPIGCRDIFTKSIFEKYNINAYLAGCNTLMYEPIERTKEMQKIFFVDIPKNAMSYIPQFIRENAEELTHEYFLQLEESSESIAKLQYERYMKEAKLVITSRLHAAVPCLAMGIPVILIREKIGESFEWVERFIPVYLPNNYSKIDWNPVPLDLRIIREKLFSIAISKIEETVKIQELQEYWGERYFLHKEGTQTSLILEKFISFIHHHWTKENSINYIIWAVTPLAKEIYNYIETNYYNAKLVAVIDEFREVKFLGLESSKKNILKKINNEYVIVMGNSACREAERELCHYDQEKIFLAFDSNYVSDYTSINKSEKKV